MALTIPVVTILHAPSTSISKNAPAVVSVTPAKSKVYENSDFVLVRFCSGKGDIVIPIPVVLSKARRVYFPAVSSVTLALGARNSWSTTKLSANKKGINVYALAGLNGSFGSVNPS